MPETNTSLRILYWVPQEEHIRRMAWHMCRDMSAIDQYFADPGSVRTLGDFLCLLARMEAARRNAEQLDNRNEQG
ncbi:MAG: hypothetical protein IT323_21360 [Anaerolineae bacterium]|nr:hypothetical protein [Anaerolineae bacterium]